MRVRVSGGSGVSQRGTMRIDDGQFRIIGDWEGNTNAAPTGVIKKGYAYNCVSSTTTLLGPDNNIIPVGAMIIALVNNPGSTLSDVTKWKILLGVSA
jgi:hypothetical protein